MHLDRRTGCPDLEDTEQRPDVVDVARPGGFQLHCEQVLG